MPGAPRASAGRRHLEDFWLRFAHQVIGLEHLHLGYWEPEDPITYQGCLAAQERYTERVLARIPSEVKSVLDVGAGLGSTSRRLQAAGLAVQAVCPDAYQQSVVEQRAAGVPLHRCRFEELRRLAAFDLVLFCESTQYIPLGGLFPVCRQQLDPHGAGYVLVADWLLRAGRSYYGGAHSEAEFLASAEREGFVLLHSEDITDRTAPTLEYLTRFHQSHLLPAYRLGHEMFELRLPKLTRWVHRLARRRMARMDQWVEHEVAARFDVDRYKESVRYRVLLLQLAARERG